MWHDSLEHILRQKSPIILDGALATELEKHDCDLADPLWSAKILLENPELIYQIHYDYFAAGADCAITASYQATPQGFAAKGLDAKQSLALIKKSVELALRARDDYLKKHPTRAPLFVAGSIGSYGAYLADGSEYRGDYSLSQDAFIDFHRPRLHALQEAGVDILAIETQPSFAETKALIMLLEEFPQSSAWFSFTLKDSEHISDGTPLDQVARYLEAQPQAVAIGVNCVLIEMADKALANLQTCTKKPLIVYPNSGEHYDATTKTWHEAASACSIADKLSKWKNLNIGFIGGCCRTTPKDIAAISAYFKAEK